MRKKMFELFVMGKICIGVIESSWVKLGNHEKVMKRSIVVQRDDVE